MRTLSGKVAFVTGGASGIGFGMVRNFLGEGMKVVIADYNEEHLAQAKQALAGSNAVHFIRVDVSDRRAGAGGGRGGGGGVRQDPHPLQQCRSRRRRRFRRCRVR